MGRGVILNGVLGFIVALLTVEIARTWARVLPPVDPAGRVSERTGAPDEQGKKRRHGVDRATAKDKVDPSILVAAIEAKDLFDPSRQKAPLEEVKVASPAPRDTGPPAGVAVVGLRLFGDDREAFVTDPSQTQGSQQRRLRIGDQIGGYGVKRIEATGMVITSPSGDDVTMPLVIEKGRAPPVPVQRAAAQAAGSPAAGVIHGTSPAVLGPSPGQEIAVQRPQGRVRTAEPAIVAAQAATPAVPPAAPPDIRDRLKRLREHQAGAQPGRNKR